LVFAWHAAERRVVGATRSQPARGRKFRGTLDVLAFDADAPGHAADRRASLERQGQLIGCYDVLMAGHARHRGLTVVTGYLGECQRVAGLRAEHRS
jgi:tRNA(fMet)-specific endonuclease VapC